MATHATTDASSLEHRTSASAAPGAGISPDSAARGPKPWICRPAVRATIYSFLVLFLAGMIAWGLVPRLLDPTFEKHIERGEVMVGMTREQVLKAWGSPYQTNISHTNEGIRREEWIYEEWKSTSDVRHRYLYFEEGILVGGWYYE